MRTYRIEKKSRFSKRSPSEKKFNFLEFLLSSGDGPAIAGPDWFDDGYLDSMKRADGSYDLYQKTGRGVIKKIDGTCYAVCAIKALGREPPKEAPDHIERLKKDDGSFRIGPHKNYSDIDTTFNAVLALSACRRPVPKESATYAKSCRNDDGNYGVDKGIKSRTLIWTWEALAVLKAAGHDLSDEEKAQTENYVLSKLDREGVSDIETCYGAVVALDLMGSGLGPKKKKMIREQFENKPATACSSYEEKFKLLVIKRLIGSKKMPEAAELNGPAPVRSMKEAYYAILAGKLAAGAGGQK